MTRIDFDRFYTLQEQGSGTFWLGIRHQKVGKRFVVRQLSDSDVASQNVYCASPSALLGDAPDKYHPLYVAALLIARNDEATPQTFLIPEIAFHTDADVRRSMTLNAMRMTREYSQDASPRILRLVTQRLEAGQRDVVHDALVYVMRQIFSAREEMQGEKNLRSEALAAYLGISRIAIRKPEARHNSELIEWLRANTRRSIDVEAVVEMQQRILRRALVPLRRAERRQLALLDRIVALLQKNSS